VRNTKDMLEKCCIPLDTDMLRDRGVIHNCPLFVHLLQEFSVFLFYHFRF